MSPVGKSNNINVHKLQRAIEKGNELTNFGDEYSAMLLDLLKG
ncbi:MAG: hypothetical protein QW379_07020 [Thermoplasmata archaeon]